MSGTKAGKKGEAAAAAELEKAGMRLIARNFHAPQGEVDLIAGDHGVLVFVEVKAWSTLALDSIEMGVGLKKRRRIIETAKLFLRNNREYSTMPVRFDIVFIGRGELIHLAGAFGEHV
jgi:putative endonuclease